MLSPLQDRYDPLRDRFAAKRVLFWIPAAGINAYSRVDVSLLRFAADIAEEVFAVECGGILNWSCTGLYAEKITPSSLSIERFGVCSQCKTMNHMRQLDQRIQWIKLESVLDINNVKHALTSLEQMNLRELTELTVDGLPLGRWCSYETLLHTKSRPEVAFQVNQEQYRRDLKSSILALMAIRGLLQETRIETLALHNPLYSINRVAWEFARDRGVNCLDIQIGNHPTLGDNSVRVLDRPWPIFAESPLADLWEISKNRVISEDDALVVQEFLRSGVKSSTVFNYSPPKSNRSADSLRRSFEIPSDNKVVVALLSSLDERVAAGHVGVNPEHAWTSEHEPLKRFIAAISEAALSLVDVTFIVRVHPRMVGSSRDAVESPELETLSALLSTLPQNVLVDWPDAGTSLYDLAPLASACISMGSSAALEVMALGIPTILYDPGQEWNYPLDIYYAVANTPTGLAVLINEALVAPRNVEQARRVFRFLVLYHSWSLYQLQDSARKASPADGRLERQKREPPANFRLAYFRLKHGVLGRVARLIKNLAFPLHMARSERVKLLAASKKKLALPDIHVAGSTGRLEARSESLLIGRTLQVVFEEMVTPVPCWLNAISDASHR